MSYVEISYIVEPPTAQLVLDRPNAMNAISPQLMQEFSHALATAESDDHVRVVILRGEGRCFSAGYDLTMDDSWLGAPPDFIVAHMQHALRWEKQVWSFPKPIIAAVHGYCLGGACELAMLADITIAADDTQLGEPEIRFSTGPPALIMPWIIGMKATRELLYTGELITAQRAYELGLVNEVCVPSDLLQRAHVHAMKLSRVAPLALRLQKQAINRTYEIMGLDGALEQAAQLTGILDASDTDEMHEFYRIQSSDGLRAALAWRQRQFDAASE